MTYQVDKMSHVNEVKEVEPIFELCDLQVASEEVDEEAELDEEEAVNEASRSKGDLEAKWTDSMSNSK